MPNKDEYQKSVRIKLILPWSITIHR